MNKLFKVKKKNKKLKEMQKKSNLKFLLPLFFLTLTMKLPYNLNSSKYSIDNVKSSDLRVAQPDVFDKTHDDRPVITTDTVGNIYIAWTNNRDQYTRFLYRKWTINDKQWGSIEEIPKPINTGVVDRCIKVDNAGNIHFVWNYYNISYLCWNSSTQKWSPLQIFSNITYYSYESPSMVISNSGDVYITWSGSHWFEDRREVIFLKIWNSTIRSWTPTMNITAITNNDLNSNPKIVIDNEDNIHLVYAKSIFNQTTGQAHGDGIHYKIWNSTTKNWYYCEQIAHSGNYPKFYIDSNDNKHLLWQYNGISYKKWRNTTKSWSYTVQVNALCEGWSRAPQMIVDYNNEPFAVWVARINNVDRIVGSRRLSVYSWSSCELISEESFEYQYDPTLTVDIFNNRHVAWTDSSPIIGSDYDFDIFYRCWNSTTGEWMPLVLISIDSRPWYLISSNEILMIFTTISSIFALVIIVYREIKRKNESL